ncbi:MAG: apolipoprotein N-acyltransferase [Planctomycetes bacterium RBG_16_59_8]|nr:MAG: apolipoprotein N-acyltransferase [Planctomycetes bacterium RBG_16_59_8]
MKVPALLSFLLPFLTALLLICSFPSVDLWPLAWAALVPLTLYALGEERSWRLFLLSFVAGYLFFLVGLWWTGYVVPVAPFLLAIYHALLVVLCAFTVRSGWRWGLSPMITLPLGWVSCEFFRAYLFTGFPWFYLGHTQHDVLPLIQICDITGVYGMSFLVAMINGLLAHLLLALRGGDPAEIKRSRIVRVGLPAGVIALVAVLGYGFIRLGTIELTKGPSLLIVQGNIPQEVKKRSHDNEDIFEQQVRVTESGLVGLDRPDLIVWAETMFPIPAIRDVQGESWRNTKRLSALAQKFSGALLVGVTVVEPPREMLAGGSASAEELWKASAKSNSALLVSREGEIVDRYDKIHLVPFGEYIPLRKTLPFIDDFLKSYSELPELPDLRAGTRHTVFNLGRWPFGVQVCYESAFPEIVRELRRQGARFIINISNDGWFKESAELDQMLAIVRFRAVESRVGVVRATNTGISAFIAPTGELSDVLVDTQGRTKSIEGTLRGNVLISESATFYVAYGDLFALLVLALFLITVGYPFLQRMKGIPSRKRPE